MYKAALISDCCPVFIILQGLAIGRVTPSKVPCGTTDPPGKVPKGLGKCISGGH